MSALVVVGSSATGAPWSPQDRVRDERVLASDRAVLLRPSGAAASLRRIPRGSTLLTLRGRDVVTADAFDAIADRMPSPPSDATGSELSSLTGFPVASVAEAAAGVRAGRLARFPQGRVAGALVPASTVRRTPVGLRAVALPPEVPTARIEIGTVRRSGPARRLRAWLTGPDGRRALDAAGLGGPDAPPTVGG